MKFLEYRPELEDTHFAELNALDNGHDVAPVASGWEAETIGTSDSLPEDSQSVQPSAGTGDMASWQMVSDTEMDGQGRNDNTEMTSGQPENSQNDVGIFLLKVLMHYLNRLIFPIYWHHKTTVFLGRWECMQPSFQIRGMCCNIRIWAL